MEEVEEAALLPAAPTLRSGKLDRPSSTGSSAVPIFWPYEELAWSSEIAPELLDRLA